MCRCFRVLSVICFFVAGAVLVFVMIGYARIPDEMTVSEFDRISVGKTYVCRTLSQNSGMTADKNEYVTSVKLFNIFPVKDARVTVTQRSYVVPGGNVFGIRLYTRGVMVIRIDRVTTRSGNRSPGREAGLKEGDMILSVDGASITRNTELSSVFASSGGRTLEMKIERNGEEKTLKFTPVPADDGTFKGGLWIRDSTAGIGTVTWYNRSNGIFAGLGHAVCDVDTGEIMPLSGGDAVEAEVKGCYRGKSGSAGELCGVFTSGTIGELYLNGYTGVYGIMNSFDKDSSVLPVALKQEVRTGAAQIICTVDENGPRYYDAEITKVYEDTSDHQRNLTIKITDEALIEKTGGIVQGMSGSPIVQNGMLVGAVTHVFVDDPTEGYGILAENMLDTAKQVEQYLEAS